MIRQFLLAVVLFMSSMVLTSIDIIAPPLEKIGGEKMIEEVQKEESERYKNLKEDLKEVIISFAGDVTLGNYEGSTYTNSFLHEVVRQNNDFSYFFRNVKPIFESDDLTLVNLEGALTTATTRVDKQFTFKGDPTYVNILKEGSVEMVNVANNHTSDYGVKGFEETLATLEEAGILYSGEGHIAYYEVKGITIGSIGYRGWSTNIKKRVAEDIKAIREKADIVVVSFHWGQERVYYPNKEQVELGRFAIDQGADVVVGHHPHVVQGIEKYNDRYIVYSLGNFCFGGNRNPEDKDTFIFQNHFVFKDGEIIGISGKIIPARISSVKERNNFQPTPLIGEEAERVLSRLYTYSSKLQYGISRENH